MKPVASGNSDNGTTDEQECWPVRAYSWSWRHRHFFLVAVILIIVAAIAVPTYLMIKHYGFKDGFPIAQSCTTFAAIIVGAIWAYLAFVRNRQKYPRANTSITVEELPLPNDSVLLKVITNIENIGTVLISVDCVWCSIYQLMPWPSDEVLKDTVMLGNDERDIEIDYEKWKDLDFREKTYEKDTFEIEPGETDDIVFDMVVNKDASLVRVYTHVENVKKRRQNKIGWSRAILYKMGVNDD